MVGSVPMKSEAFSAVKAPENVAFESNVPSPPTMVEVVMLNAD